MNIAKIMIPKISTVFLYEKDIPVLAAGSSSYRFGRMPDIAAMPVGRKTTASVKRQVTLLF